MDDGVNTAFLPARSLVDTNSFTVYTCQKTQPKRCDFFLWDDEAKGREAAAVLNNSRTEPFPLPSPAPETPQKLSPFSLPTPQTSSSKRWQSPDVTTPYKPSKSSRDLPPSSAARHSMEASTTQGSDSEEEFYDWPASDDDELSKVAEKASSGDSMPPPETPRKAVKTDASATPGKRRYDEMASGNKADATSAWPTPSTTTTRDDVFTTPSTNTVGRRLFTAAIPATPTETPTPIRYKDSSSTEETDLASEIITILEDHNVTLSAAPRDAVKSICNRHVLYTWGIMKGRDVSRAIVKTKDERTAELQSEIDGLKAERETNRAVIRHLRRDMATRKETQR
ncbi:hypothetical protein ACLMJK_002683 [Lecanora helva]